jgi:hypothetical protein
VRITAAKVGIAAAAPKKHTPGRLCEHSLEYVRSRGYRAMQFNFVVSTTFLSRQGRYTGYGRKLAKMH